MVDDDGEASGGSADGDGDGDGATDGTGPEGDDGGTTGGDDDGPDETGGDGMDGLDDGGSDDTGPPPVPSCDAVEADVLLCEDFESEGALGSFNNVDSGATLFEDPSAPNASGVLRTAIGPDDSEAFVDFTPALKPGNGYLGTTFNVRIESTCPNATGGVQLAQLANIGTLTVDLIVGSGETWDIEVRFNLQTLEIGGFDLAFDAYHEIELGFSTVTNEVRVRVGDTTFTMVVDPGPASGIAQVTWGLMTPNLLTLPCSGFYDDIIVTNVEPD